MILRTPESALAYARKKIPHLKPSSAVALPGGYVNFVYRVSCEAGSVILKNYPPFIATSPSSTFSTDRFHVEVAALRLSDWTQGSDIRIPKILLADEENFCIFMEDAGTNLVSLLDCLTNSEDQNQLQEQLLSSWPTLTIGRLAEQLHGIMQKLSEAGTDEAFTNPTAWAVLQQYYGTYPPLAATLDIPADWVDKAPDFQPPPPGDQSMIHGDLWPNTVHLNPDSKTIWILDWEMTRRGNICRDANQLMDNLWIMLQNPNKYRKTATTALIHALQEAYYGSSERDWRQGRAADFLRSVVMLSQFPHWELKDTARVAAQALHEIEAHQF